MMGKTIPPLKSSLSLMSATSLATIFEWYDFSLFAYLTPVFSGLFFPKYNALTALMLTYGIFAVGFFARPLGAILFGHLGDRIGRKTALIWSISLMSLSTLFIGLLPTYHSIGIAAPLLLILLRVGQGLSAGGESIGGILFVLESMPTKHRGLMGGLMWSMVGIGMLLGSLAATLVLQNKNYDWLWRIPFLLGVFTGVLAYFLRLKTEESALFKKVIQNNEIIKFPLWVGISKYRSEMLVIVGLYILSAMITYLIFIFMPSYASLLGIPLANTSVINTVSFLTLTLLVPLGGYLSDKMGRKFCLRWTAVGFIILSYPLCYLISKATINNFIFAQTIFVLLAVCFQGALTATVFEILPTQVRYTISALGYNLSYSIFGGTAPFIATYIVNLTGNKSSPGLYLIAGAIISLLAVNKIHLKHTQHNTKDFV